MKNQYKRNYVIVREDLHSNTFSPVAFLGDVCYKKVEECLEKYAAYAERECLPYLYSVKG